MIALAASGLTPTSLVVAEAGTVEASNGASTTKEPEAPSATARRLGLRASRPAVASRLSLAVTSPPAWALLYVAIMQIPLLRSVLFVALTGGCAGTGQFTVASEVTTPDLVVISPGVQVIADLDEPVFYSGNYYWRNQGGFWYRSTSHTRGWARVEVAPVEIRAIERPSAYVHYHGEARAHASGERRGPAPAAVVRDHREERDRREIVAPAPPRDDRHDKDGHDKDGHDKDGHDRDGHDKDRHDRDGHDRDDRHHE